MQKYFIGIDYLLVSVPGPYCVYNLIGDLVSNVSSGGQVDISDIVLVSDHFKAYNCGYFTRRYAIISHVHNQLVIMIKPITRQSKKLANQ